MSDREIERWSAEGSMIGDSGTIYGPWSDGTPRAKYTRTWVKYEDHCNIVKDLKRAIMTAKAEAYEDAAKMIEEGFDRVVGEPYADDGRPSKNDKCPHNRYMYEDCEACCVGAIRSKANRRST